MSLADRTIPTPEEFDAYKERFSNWGRWGEDDQLGTLNHISEDVRQQAAGLVQTGRSVSCARPLATEQVLSGRRNESPADHRMNIGGMGSSDYIGVSYHGFANTHIDALCHIFTADGRLYNGRPKSDVTEDGAGMTGSLLIVEAADLAAAHAFAAGDPYAKAGLFESVAIRPWKWVIGNPDA